jgi:voltage-gated potassium channel
MNYLRNAWTCLQHVRGLLITLIGVIAAGAFVFSWVEGIELADSAYFSLITALTIGYGDIQPVTGAGRATSVVIGFAGLFTTGLVIGVATHALRLSMHEMPNPDSDSP